MKNIRNSNFYLFILLLSTCASAQAQRFDSALSKLNKEYKQEKLYLHFDRDVYNAGDTIWFKAYLFTGNYPSQISKTLYAELLDDKGKVLERRTAPIVMSSAAAAFDLPPNLANSVVYIRAYTKWMLNFDSSFIYTKAITIATLKKTAKEFIAPRGSLHFFPEGGDLVQDVASRVAYKATDQFGMPINISGDVLDNKSNKILSFKSEHDGMGSFELQPKPGEIYKAIWKDEKGKTHETLLPVAKQNGIVIEVSNNLLQIEFKVKRAANSPLLYPFVYVVAQVNQQLLYKAKANLTKLISVSGIIPLESLPSGIVQVTILTPDETPIAERITFINPSASSFITDLNTALNDMGKRKKNVIQIDVPDTIACNLSVSITDADLDPVAKGDNIFSNILLTSDIKGYVHQPAYYFSSDADSVADHLDLVMMTNGWRRFNWKNIMANHWPKIIYQPENYIAIEGQIHGLNKTLLANKELNGVIELKNKNREFLSTPVFVDGQFIFPDMIFYDTAKLFYQFNNDKNKSLTSNASFDIKTNLLKATLQLKPDSLSLLSLIKLDTSIIAKNVKIYKEQLSDLELRKVKTLKEVVITTKKKSKQEMMDEEYTSGLFSGGDNRTFLPEDDISFLSSQSVLSYLQSRVAGLQVSTGAQPSISWRGSPTALFMNEMVQDIGMIQTIPMSDVAMIKVFNPPFFGAFGAGAGGAVAVYLKKGATGNQMVKGLDNVTISGYSPVKEFYSPDYSKINQMISADYRKTLYWNPFVITDKKKRRILLPFYNNDITKKLKIIVEGCNEDGKLTRVEKILQ
ncbi:MAG: hypothetical protein ACR2KX_06905 [Chitinophagaceae bacterium]